MNGQRISGAGVERVAHRGAGELKEGGRWGVGRLPACTLALAAGTQACCAVAVVADLY